MLSRQGQPPNKRLKLTGVYRSRGIRMLFARVFSLLFNMGCAPAGVARRLSAIR